MEFRRLFFVWWLLLLGSSVIGNSASQVEAIVGSNVSLPALGLEEASLPSDFSTTSGYVQIVETSNQLWACGPGGSEGNEAGMWNLTKSGWVKFRNSTGGGAPAAVTGYRVWTTFNNTHMFTDEAGSPDATHIGGRRIFTTDGGKSWNATNESALMGTGVQKLHNGSFVMTHWGDDLVWISENLMDWTPYKNITRWMIAQGYGIDPYARSPHMCVGVSVTHMRLYVDYQTYIDFEGGTDYSVAHVTIQQNLETGEWSELHNRYSNELSAPLGQHSSRKTTFAQMVETSKVVVHGDVDRDTGELKVIEPAIEDKWYLVDVLQNMGSLDGKISVGQTPNQLASENDVIYVTYTALFHESLHEKFNYGIMISPDHGVTWGTLLKRNASDGKDHSFRLWSGARHLYILDDDEVKLYRMSYLTQDEAWAVINNKYVSRSVSTIAFEKTLSNQTKDAVDLSQYGDISDATITLIGSSYFNKLGNNSGYEWGNKTGFSGVHIGNLRVLQNNAIAFEGEWYGNLTATREGWWYLSTDPLPWPAGLDARGVSASFYGKWDGSGIDQAVHLSIFQRNSSDGTTYLARDVTPFSFTSSWTRMNTSAPYLKAGYDQIYIQIRIKMTSADSLLTDAFLIEEVHQDVQGVPPSEDKILNCFFPGNYFRNELRTRTPSVILNGQTFSCSGILNDGQETTPEPITLPKTGMAEITSITVAGSGLVKIVIRAKAGVIAEGIFLREYTGNAYVGHFYYDSYIFSAETQIVAFCDSFANITTADFDGNTLTFTILAERGRTSTTKVYSGDKGKPTGITGASSWTYNGTSRTLTVLVAHTNEQEVVVDWTPPDIAVTHISLSKTIVSLGYNVRIYVTVENQGNWLECFNITIYANASAIQTQRVILESVNSRNITFTWDTTSSAKGIYTISATAIPHPSETDIDDNTLTDGTILVAIPGDVDGDRSVNVLDLTIVALSYGSFTGEPDFNPEADINEDGIVDMNDLIVVALHLGRSEP